MESDWVCGTLILRQDLGITMCVVFASLGQHTRGNSLFREETVISAHGFRGFSPWFLGPITLACGGTVFHGREQGRGGCLPHDDGEAKG